MINIYTNKILLRNEFVNISEMNLRLIMIFVCLHSQKKGEVAQLVRAQDS